MSFLSAISARILFKAAYAAMSASGRKRASSCTAAALLGRFFLVEQRRQIDRVGEGDAVEDRRGVVANAEHQAAQAAFGFGQAILAMLMRIARRAGDERERAARQADEVAIADVDRSEERRVGKGGVSTCRFRGRQGPL